MSRSRSLAGGLALAGAIVLPLWGVARADAQPKPEGEMRWALYVTLSPLWFDPGEVSGQITPFWVLYALHDALVKPMPGNLMAPSLAESWAVSADQRAYEFKLREGLPARDGSCRRSTSSAWATMASGAPPWGSGRTASSATRPAWS